MTEQSAIETQQAIPEFLRGGGEMGERIRSFDWSKTSLGDPATWDNSLKTCIRIMLTSSQPIWIGWGKDLIKFYNDPYKDIVQGKHPWALGTPASIVWKDIWSDIEPLLQKVMEDNEGTFVESQLLIMERNGYPEETYYTFSYNPIPGDKGGTAGMFCANSDDTDKIISGRQLRTLTDLGKVLIDSKTREDVIKDTIDILAENPFDFPVAFFREINSNKAIFKYSSSLGEAKKIIPREVDLDGDGEIAKYLRTAIETRKPQTMSGTREKIGELPKGVWEASPDKVIAIPVLPAGNKEPYGLLIVGMNPYRLADEKYISFFSLIADQMATSFSQVAAIEEERKRAEALAEIDKAKTVFFTNISHEFRTPLTLMLGSLEELLNDREGANGHYEIIRTTHRNALRLLRLVNNLLDFSRIEAGRTKAQFQLTDISQFTIDLASNFRGVVESAGLKFEVKAEKDISVYIDKEMWEKIVLNLLSNAFKYTLDGGITVSLTADSNNVLLSVKDTGVGIPQAELPKMFQRFHRVHQNTGRSFEGTGIGLSLVKELVNLHGGTIYVHSEEGKGSEFTVTIPLGKTHLEAKQVIDAEEGYASALTDGFVNEASSLIETLDGQEQTIKEKEATVLVVDDNADMRSYMRNLLQKHFNVLTAGNGEEALQKISHEKPDLIVSDIMMPVMDGIQLLKEIKANDNTATLPVILVSARAGEEARVEGFDIGADDYLVKPFSSIELVARVRSQIRLAKKRAAAENSLRSLFHQAPALMHIMKGPDHVFDFFHPMGIPLVGGRDLTGMKVREALPEYEGQGYFEMLDDVYQNGTTISVKEIKSLLRDAEGNLVERYFDATYQPYYDEDGKILGVFNMAIEVTDKMNAQKILVASEEKFRTLAEALPQMVWMRDKDGVLEYASNAWTEYSGIEDTEVAFQTMVHPADREHAMYNWRQALEHGKPYRHELRLKNKEGVYKWYYSVAEPIRDEHGEIIKWIGVLTDINTQKTFAENLEKIVEVRTRELYRSNEDLQQFAHVASHDLKEPVRKIKTFTSSLAKEIGGNLTDKARLYLDKIDKATNRMFFMIEGVLSYSTLNSTEQPTEQVNLNNIIRNIESDLELVIQQKNAKIITNDLPDITGAPVLIYQLFYNLVNNSLKFARSDVAPDITIEAEAPANDEMVTITVADNGIGFEQEYADRIFNTFTRLNSKDKYEGTGLGLALCKKIVERHQGTINAYGKTNEGAKFVIRLPVNLAEKEV